MPQLKQQRTLQEATVRIHCKKYCGTCQRWLLNLHAALHDGRRAYFLVLNTVLDECHQIANELSTIAPDILELLSPRLAKEFGKMIRNYDESALVLQPIFWDVQRHLFLCRTIFRSVLSDFIETFDVTLSTEEIMHLIIIHNLDAVPNLLAFSILVFTENHSALLASKIYHLTNLQIFKYRCYCTDDIVALLGMHCPLLKEVDISISVGVTNASVQHLMELRELKFLNVEGTNIYDEHYAMILSELPNIAIIRFWKNESSILCHITVEILDKITHINGSFLDINTVTNKCPNTTNISLTSDSRDLSGLTAFNALHALTFNNLDYRICNLTAVMKGIGHRLTDLEFLGAKRVNLRDIITLCPSLVNLSFVCSTYLRLNANRPFDPQVPHFRNLFDLEIDIFSREPHIFSFIRYCVSLKTIVLKTMNIFTDDFEREIITLGTFRQLESIQLKEHGLGALTMEGLRMLIGHCPFLESIEGLGRCPRLNSHLIRQLRDEMESHNFDLEIGN